MEVIRIIPRGYCHGVVTAINMVAEVLRDPNVQKPIYIIGQIIHNKKVTDAFAEVGAITLEGETRADIISQVSEGTVIITAHGIDSKLICDAKSRGLNVVDATCKDVYKTHDLIKKYIEDDYTIFYIGQKKHPETEAVLAMDTNINLLENPLKEDQIINVTNSKIMVTNQTTMSMWDVQDIIDIFKNKYPDAVIHNEVCDATQLRQEAVLLASQECDLVIVVGDRKSNNTNKLVEVCEKNGSTLAIRIEDIDGLDLEVLKEVKKVGVTAGASTPSILVKQICDFLETFDYFDKETWQKPESIISTRLIPKI